MNADATLRRFDEAKIDAILAPLDQCHKPGGAVAIAIGGVPVYRKGFGLASLELPALLTPGIRMRIGSTTKHFTCLAYLLLCEEGRASLDDPIERHVAEIHAVAHGITMRQLMGHTSGLRDIFGISMVVHGPGVRITDQQLREYYQTIDDVDFAPGTEWSYNNGGYVLLTAAIERLAGQPLDDVLRTRIFQPLGMNDTMLRRWDTDFVPNSATLHMVNARGEYTRDYMGLELTGAGGLVSTMDDMLVWLKHMDAPTVGSARTWQALRETHRLANGHSTGYGLGLMTVPYRGVEVIMHGGAVMGGSSQMLKVPSAGLDISIAVNRADANASVIADQILDVLLDGLQPLPEKANAEAIEGVYVSPTSGRVVELSVLGGMQLLSFDGAPGLPVEMGHDGVLRLPAMLRYLQWAFKPEGDSGRLVEFGNEDVMRRIEVRRDASVAPYIGTYRADSLSSRAEVTASGDGARLVLKGRYGSAAYDLEPITARTWRARPLGPFAALTGIVAFDEKGTGFHVTAGRIQRLRFARD
jgi:CubicO group peptidase (beta-lactamase class C family)